MLTIVVGPPCSGKTTYIREHNRDGLPVFDPESTLEPDREGIVKARREFIESNDSGFVSACREFICEKNHAVVRMDADLDRCLANLSKSDRTNKDEWETVIKSYFNESRCIHVPYKPNQREYRNFDMQLEPQEVEGVYIVEGYATTFDVPYDFGYDGVKECIRSTALDGADLSDVIFQLNHEGQTLARLRNGSMQLETDGHGLKVRADLGGSTAGRELYEAIKSGLIDKMSWGFAVAKDGWEYDHDTRTSYVNKVSKVFDVSAVSIPADADTEIHARSYLDGVIEAEKQELLSRDREERQRAALKLRLMK